MSRANPGSLCSKPIASGISRLVSFGSTSKDYTLGIKFSRHLPCTKLASILVNEGTYRSSS